MKFIEKKPVGIVISLSKDEVGILANALNEVCHGIDIPEFQTRMGCEEQEAKRMLSELCSIYKSN